MNYVTDVTPPAFRHTRFLRAYGLGFLSYLSPRLFSLLLSKAKRRRSNKQSRALAPAVSKNTLYPISYHRATEHEAVVE